MNLERVAAGILGSCGVAAAAASAHGGDQRLMSAVALVCLAHAPALLAISTLRDERTVRIAALLLFAGAAIFSADLALRALHDARLFPMAAPTGGVILILGWLILMVSGFFRGRQ
ncbi:MAG: DUF423 domain-containing protein [Nitratireductor sp.]